eukprot:GHVU01137916.1.p1 GENE.GHVU01137916.1~~GHVU01137916.1.p1  ORF type:complete len:248 (-),score=28.02 GHVU01137916.1:70-813(-)
MPNLSLVLMGCLVAVLVPGGEGAEVSGRTSMPGREEGLWDRLLAPKRLIPDGMPVGEFSDLFQAMEIEGCWTDEDDQKQASAFAKLVELTDEEREKGRGLVGSCADDLRSKILKRKMFEGGFNDKAIAVDKAFFYIEMPGYTYDERLGIEHEEDEEMMALRFLDVLTNDEVVAAYEGPGTHVSTFMNLEDLGSQFKEAIEYVQERFKEYQKRVHFWNWKNSANDLLNPTELKRLILHASSREYTPVF